jgi:hypothetical protein
VIKPAGWVLGDVARDGRFCGVCDFGPTRFNLREEAQHRIPQNWTAVETPMFWNNLKWKQSPKLLSHTLFN